MKKLAIWAQNEASEGAKALAKALDVKRIKHENSKYKAGPGKVVINWGDSQLPKNLQASEVLNSPHVLGAMTNKLKFFQLMADTDVRIPEFTTDRYEALNWIEAGGIVVERHKLSGHSAEGLRIVEKLLDIKDAPCYTKYIPKKDEYRIHFVRGKIIDIQQKKKRLDFEGEVNWKVRNHANGFIYARNDIDVPEDVLTQANNTINACGLDFGAIDAVYNQKQRQAFILEVNTAPGLEGETVEIYAKAFKEVING